MTLKNKDPFFSAALFVPASTPNRFFSAISSGASSIFIDLEDAVASDKKNISRSILFDNYLEIKRLCQIYDCHFFIRINPISTEWYEDDLKICSEIEPNGILLPKPENYAQVSSLHKKLPNVKIHLLMETLNAFNKISELSHAPGVKQLMLGCIDLMLDIGAESDDRPLDYYRSLIVMHSRLAGLMPPMDGVCLSISDRSLLDQEISRARAFGFGSKACIHPSQVEIVINGFSPTSEQIIRAKKVLKAGPNGEAVSVDGILADGPVMHIARNILKRASIMDDVDRN